MTQILEWAAAVAMVLSVGRYFIARRSVLAQSWFLGFTAVAAVASTILFAIDPSWFRGGVALLITTLWVMDLLSVLRLAEQRDAELGDA